MNKLIEALFKQIPDDEYKRRQADHLAKVLAKLKAVMPNAKPVDIDSFISKESNIALNGFICEKELWPSGGAFYKIFTKAIAYQTGGTTEHGTLRIYAEDEYRFQWSFVPDKVIMYAERVVIE